MENINVTLGLDDDAIEKIAQKLEDVIDIQDKVKDAIDDYDFSDLDLSDNVNNYIQYDVDFRSIVSDELQDINMSEYLDVDDLNLDSKAEDMLCSYSPISNCSTAQAFTQAVTKAVRYILLKNDDFVDDIANALEKRIEKQKKAEMKASIIEEMKPLLFDEFKAELERYAAHLEVQKAQEILSQSGTHIIPEIPTDNNGY